MPGKPKSPPLLERVSGLQSDKDRREALDTLTRAFGNFNIENHCASCLWKGKIYDPEHTRIAVADARVVSAVVFAPRAMRFGPVEVPAVTVGPVGTHDKYRKFGFSAAAMNDVSKYLADNGYLIAYLQGIPNYYHRYGYYAFAPTRSSVKFNRENASREMAGGRFVKMSRKHLDAVRAIYDEVSKTKICTSMRGGTLWEWLATHGRRTWLFANPKVVIDGSGDVCGYITNNSKTSFDVREVVIKPDEASCRAALGAFVREAKRLETKDITMTLAPDDAFALFLRQFVATEYTQQTNPTGGALMKIVDFPALMHRLEPLFIQRWQSAQTKLPGEQFTIETDKLGSVGAAVDAKIVSSRGGGKVRIPARWLSGLLTGWYAPKDIAQREGVVIPQKLMPYVEILFPRCSPFVYQADNY